MQIFCYGLKVDTIPDFFLRVILCGKFENALLRLPCNSICRAFTELKTMILNKAEIVFEERVMRSAFRFRAICVLLREMSLFITYLVLIIIYEVYVQIDFKLFVILSHSIH